MTKQTKTTTDRNHLRPELVLNADHVGYYTLYSILLDSSDDSIIGKDLKGIIFSWNKAAERLYGYTQTEILGCSIKKLFQEDKQNEFDNIILKIANGESIKHKKTVCVHKNGHIIPVSVTLSPIKDVQGKIVGALTVAHDLSKQNKVAERARHDAVDLKRLNHELLTSIAKLKKNEVELIESSAALKKSFLYNRTIIEANISPILVIDNKGKISDINKGDCILLKK